MNLFFRCSEPLCYGGGYFGLDGQGRIGRGVISFGAIIKYGVPNGTSLRDRSTIFAQASIVA
jgi:hypothetical protein